MAIRGITFKSIFGVRLAGRYDENKHAACQFWPGLVADVVEVVESFLLYKMFAQSKIPLFEVRCSYMQKFTI